MARILIIEDEPAITMVLKEVLSDEGHEVFTAPDGLAGLEMLRRFPKPEILLVDLFVPGMSGRDIVQTVRSDSELQDIPVILITGAVPNARDFPPKESYQGIIGKPFDVIDVIAKVHFLIGRGEPGH